MLDDEIRRQNVSGAVAAITHQGSDQILLAAGFEDLEHTQSMRAESQFPIWSISKTYIAVVVLKLAQRNILMLEDRLGSWLPEFEFARSANIRQTLNHTSGLPDYGALPLYVRGVRDRKDPWSYSQFIEHTCSNGLLFDPGQGWSYSNIGYMALCRLIEVATGHTLAEVIRSEIAVPLQLTQTVVVQHSEDFEVLAPGYSRFLDLSGPLTDVREWFHPGWVAHGFLASTTTEVNRFMEGIFVGDLLKQDSLLEMLRLVPIPHQSGNAGYGLGIASEIHPDYGSHYGHEGSGCGYRVITHHVLNLFGQGTTISVLLNSDECNTRRIADALLDTLQSHVLRMRICHTTVQGCRRLMYDMEEVSVLRVTKVYTWTEKQGKPGWPEGSKYGRTVFELRPTAPSMS
jgi:D-alanyl-D-alanine carboxypeptidase